MSEELPYAPERLELAARKMLETGWSPEEYAGRRGACIYVFGLHRYLYQSPETTAWIQRLAEIIFNDKLVEQYQRQYLTPEEIEEIRLANKRFLDEGAP